MRKIQRYKRKINNFFYDHYILKKILYEVKGFFIAVLGAIIFAVGFTLFVLPNEPFSTMKFATGGVSGLSQVLALVVHIFGGTIPDNVLTAIGYVCFNLPLLVFAFFKIGKRFSIQTAINVGASSLFLVLVPQMLGGENGFMYNLLATGSRTVNEVVDLSTAIGSMPFLRGLFGGVIIGLSSAITYKAEFSCGGIDIITYYISNKKSTSVGKFGVAVNAVIIAIYSILLAVDNGGNWGAAVGPMLFSLVYLIIVNVVVDLINLRNKKLRVEIITTHSDMGEILISNFPHGATMAHGNGVYSGREQFVFWMIVSSNEVKKVVELARKVDSHSFISVTSLVQVYGSFFIKPIN